MAGPVVAIAESLIGQVEVVRPLYEVGNRDYKSVEKNCGYALGYTVAVGQIGAAVPPREVLRPSINSWRGLWSLIQECGTGDGPGRGGRKNKNVWIPYTSSIPIIAATRVFVRVGPSCVRHIYRLVGLTSRFHFPLRMLPITKAVENIEWTQHYAPASTIPPYALTRLGPLLILRASRTLDLCRATSGASLTINLEREAL
jgi:hypothetical protein